MCLYSPSLFYSIIAALFDLVRRLWHRYRSAFRFESLGGQIGQPRNLKSGEKRRYRKYYFSKLILKFTILRACIFLIKKSTIMYFLLFFLIYVHTWTHKRNKDKNSIRNRNSGIESAKRGSGSEMEMGRREFTVGSSGNRLVQCKARKVGKLELSWRLPGLLCDTRSSRGWLGVWSTTADF